MKMETPTIHAQLRGVVAGGKGYGISHSWNGTVLTVTSDSGTSSADLIGPAGPMGTKQYVVTFTENEGTFTADKTFAEVKAVVGDGNLVVADWLFLSGALRGHLTGLSDALLEFTFHSFLGADEYLILGADDVVTHVVSDVGEETLPSLVSVTKIDENTIEVVETCGWGDETTNIALNENGDPVSVTKGDEIIHLRWWGFDE